MVRTSLIAAILVGSVSIAAAQTVTIPSPANPTPDYPVATDGTPLPSAIDGRTRFVAGSAGVLPSFTGFYVEPRNGDRR